MTANQKFKLTTILVVFFSIVIFNSCKKGNDTIAASVSGKIIDETNSPIGGAIVSIGATQATSLADGTFTISGVPAGNTFLVSVMAQNYFPGYRNVENIDGSSTYTQIMLISRPPVGIILSGGSGTVSASGGVKITAQAGGFKTQSGQIFSGDVRVFARSIDASNLDLLARVMPGGDFQAIDTSGNTGVLESFGFTSVQFEDMNGNTLNPVSGMVNVAVNLGTGVPDPISSGANAWAFSPTTGQWSMAGTITNSSGEYFLPQTTVYQNMDFLYLQTGYILGRVVCSDGKPASDVEVVATSASNRNKYITRTNANGRYRIRVAIGNSGTIYNIAAGGGTTSVTATPNNTVSASNIVSTTACSSNTGFTAGTLSWTINGQTYITGSMPPDIPASGTRGGYFGISASSGAANPNTAKLVSISINMKDTGYFYTDSLIQGPIQLQRPSKTAIISAEDGGSRNPLDKIGCNSYYSRALVSGYVYISKYDGNRISGRFNSSGYTGDTLPYISNRISGSFSDVIVGP